MKIIKHLISVGAILLLCGSVFAEDAASIINKSVTSPKPAFSRTQITVELFDKGKSIEKRNVLQCGNNKSDVTQTTFDFKSPASIKDTRFLQSEKSNGQDTKYIYLPSLRTTRQIASAERKKDFVGTDFTYNDMTLRHADDDSCEMLDENASVTAGGKTYNVWKIKTTPVAKKNVEYSYRIQYIDKESYLPILAEHYDKTDRLLKAITIEALEKVQGETGKSYWLRKTQYSENKLTGHATRITVEKYQFDKEVPDSMFTQNWLTTGK